jgi:hypothetical protein
MAAKIKRGDRRPGVTITCKNGSQPANLTLATSLRLIGKLGSTKIIDRPVVGNADGTVVIDVWEISDTANPGKLQLEVEVIWADGTPQTFPGDRYLEVDIIPDLG